MMSAMELNIYSGIFMDIVLCEVIYKSTDWPDADTQLRL